MTEHEQLVERVRAVVGDGCYGLNESECRTRCECRDIARAAISTIAEALREPTEKMERAGWEVEELVTPDRTWAAMLSASPLNGEQK